MRQQVERMESEDLAYQTYKLQFECTNHHPARILEEIWEKRERGETKNIMEIDEMDERRVKTREVGGDRRGT